MEYKRLGDYIREVNVRNWDEKVTNLLGLSMSKQFRPSTSNIVGVDLSKYKVVSKNVFAFDPMSVIRVHKVPIAMNDSDSPIIVSPAYYTFESKDENKLDPKFLMMWFQRVEFDRYADFKSDAAVRGGYDWNELCDTIINLPSIERQREIVSEYETLSNRIRLNEQMIQRLEATAQALYRKMFVDSIDKENLPNGWRMGTLGDLCKISSSKRIFESEYCDEGIPFYRGKEISQKRNGEQITDLIYISRLRYQELVRKYGKPENGDILLTAVGTIGNSYMVQNEDFYFKDGNLVWFHSFSMKGSNAYIYEYLQSDLFKNIVSEITIGSTQKAITIQSLLAIRMLIPDDNSIMIFGKLATSLHRSIQFKHQENSKLKELQSLLLAKMGNLKQ